MKASYLQEITLFSDLGVDSLLPISITDRIQQRTGLKFPAIIPTSYPTIGSLRTVLKENIDSKGTLSSQSTTDSDLPETSHADISASNNREDSSFLPSSVSHLNSAIVSNTGSDASDINHNTRLGDLGVDSFMMTATLAE